MTTIQGMVDDKRRPLIELQRQTGQSAILALIDTGCDGALVVDDETARALGVLMLRQSIPAQLADGSETVFRLGRLDILWRGVTRTVSVRVSPEGHRLFDDAYSFLEPKALLGSELLAQMDLRVDYCARTVSVSPCVEDIVLA